MTTEDILFMLLFALISIVGIFHLMKFYSRFAATMRRK